MNPNVVINKVKRLEKYSRMLDPTNNKTAGKVKAWDNVISPLAKGLFFVLSMFLSVSRSNIWFNAADDAAKKANPSKLPSPEKIFE